MPKKPSAPRLPLIGIEIYPTDPTAEGPRAMVATWAEADAVLAQAPAALSLTYRIRWAGDKHYPKGYGASGRVFYGQGPRDPLQAVLLRHQEELRAVGGDATLTALLVAERCELGGDLAIRF